MSSTLSKIWDIERAKPNNELPTFNPTILRQRHLMNDRGDDTPIKDIPHFPVTEELKPFLVKWINPLAFTLAFFFFGMFGCWAAYKLQPKINYQVDKATCTCDCFDRITKGGFFSEGKQYKSIYVNYEKESWFLITWAGFYVWLLNRTVSRIWDCLVTRRMRWLVLPVLLINSYQQVYNWSMIHNYLNDRIYHLLPTQLYFNVTEWLLTIMLYYLIQTGLQIPWEWLAPAAAISFSHVVLALHDQGWYHLFVDPKYDSYYWRDMAFFIGDFFPFLVFLWFARPLRLKQSLVIVVSTILLIGIYFTIEHFYGYSYN